MRPLNSLEMSVSDYPLT